MRGMAKREIEVITWQGAISWMGGLNTTSQIAREIRWCVHNIETKDKKDKWIRKLFNILKTYKGRVSIVVDGDVVSVKDFFRIITGHEWPDEGKE